MAKKFNDIYKEAKTKVYSQSVNALVVLASLNPQVVLEKKLQPGAAPGDLTAAPQYTIQRRKRPTVKAVQNANRGNTADALAVLDSFAKTEYEAVEIGTNALRSIGFRRTFGDSYDFSSDPQHAKDMMYQVGEIAAQRKKDLNTLLLTATETANELPTFAKDDTKVWDAIADQIDAVSKVDDEYMDIAGHEDIITVVSDKVAKELAKEMGTVFNQEAPIAESGFKTNMSVNGSPVIVESRWTGREVVIFHKQAIYFESNTIAEGINVDLGIAKYTGEVFYDISGVIDQARFTKFKPATP